MPTYRYVGNPGYTFVDPETLAAYTPGVGEEVELPANHDLGEDFEPVTKSKAKPSTDKES